ncbi:GNAT family N-acetyltransferase [Aerosakkonema funiforme]|uniref:GNAT family N-acetyltransferase n=1 Tax=Aerosakkonema funiforme TaxID=1246630 RepID=UPI0035B71F07
MDAIIRKVTAEDTDSCSRIIYLAFKEISDRHQVPSFFPNLEFTTQVTASLIANPSVYGVVAESNGEVIGANFLNESDTIRKIGPTAVHPDFQSRKIGRKLMEALLARSRDAISVRLVQESANLTSLSLYASCGFEVKEPAVLIHGQPKSQPNANVEVRLLQQSDLEECAAICKRVYGFERVSELQEAIELFSPFVAIRNNKIVAYATAVNFYGHGVAESEADMRSLLLGIAAATDAPISLILPLHHQASLFRWCLSEGLRAINAVNLMVLGEYAEPQGCYFPSVVY